MAAPLRRKTATRCIPKRRPLNLRTLQMMVQSGVVRRADFDPPSLGSRTRFHVLDDIDHDSVKEMVAEQGWLTRLLLGRKAQLSISKRS
jgi:hypothetical protein